MPLRFCPWGFRPGLVTMLIVAFGAVGNARAAENDAEQLGQVRLAITEQPPPPPEELRRVALLLIDCSASMREGVNGPNSGPGNPQRWTEVRTGLERTLKELLAASPGIEVRLRFFGTFLDCLGQGRATATLLSQADVDVLMAKVPRDVPNRNECTTTALYESTVKCVQELREENRQRKFDWWIFGVFSDGKDGPDSQRRPSATTTEKERSEQLTAMRTEGAAEPLVWIVGPEAAKAAGDKAYGPSRVLTIRDSIPVPEKPKTRYTLSLANGQQPGVQIDHAAKAGRHTLLVSVTGDLPSGGNVVLVPELVGPSPFRVQTKEVSLGAGMPMAVELDLPQDVDRSQGASARFTFRALSATSTDKASFDGEPEVAFTYTADRTLPPEQWTLIHAPAERRGTKTMFAATPGQATSPQWVFQGPNGVVEREDGLVVSHAFATAGRWTCEFSCTSESGARLARKAEPIEIVDASFMIEPAKATIGLDEPATFRIERAPGADSAASFSCLFDGQPVAVAADGKSITLPAECVNQIGRHMLAVVARTRQGDFDWRSEAAISVKASPRVAIVPSDFIEGLDAIPVDVEAYGDIGGAVKVFANSTFVADYPVIYPSPEREYTKIQAKIPTADLAGAEVDIAVRPKKEDACAEARATLQGRPADIHASLKSPVSGAKVSARGGRSLVLQPAGDDAGRVGDIQFEVALAGPDESPHEGGLIADQANDWTVALPRQSHLGQTSVFARPVGGRLRSDLFPAGKDWKKIGSLEVVPEAQWIPFLLCVLGILGGLYVIWTALAGNKARFWIVQTTLSDPGKPTESGGFKDAIRLRRRAPGGLRGLGGNEVLKTYDGWPRWNWCPTRPPDFFWPFELESKNTTILLWQIAAAHPGVKWLAKAVGSNPNLPIVVRGAWPQMPFSGLPDHREGHPWRKSLAYPFLEGTKANYSETYRLTTTQRDDHSVWIRVKQPKRRGYLETWLWYALVILALLFVAYLARRFHCFY